VLSNRTLANSEFMASILRECGFSDVDVLHPGFLLLSPIPATPSERKRQVVFLGRFERDKRVLETIRLMESLHARCQGLDFVLCGARGSERDFNEITETLSKASAPIRMVVHPDRASIDNLLRESMFYINAKPFEHFGMATVEAMDAGCIPLLHHSGSHPEIIGGEDLLFRNAEDLAAIVERLLADPVEAARVQSAMRTSVERFRLDVFSDRLKEIVFGG
jgi:glycosyltransferase involved in cell wall biosynthesis